MTENRSPQELVQDFLRAQNLEQIGRIEEAIALYESVVADAFDAAGPYDRLIWIYQTRSLHREVIRVAQASIANVHTYQQKQDWYRLQIEQSKQALTQTPEPRPRLQ